jgi:hypothetical protein
MFDVGGLLFRKRGVLEAGGGFEYWHNMYGKPADSKPGAKQMTPFVQLTVNLNPRRE